ncbi:MAG: GEVED domain-containing protein, partial [Bacteroidota bacterium]
DGSQSNVTELNYNIPNLAAGSYSVTVDDGTTSLNKLTTINEIPAGGGGGSLPTGYCSMSGPSPWQEWIEQVILNTIDNTSGKCIDGISCGFNDYSASQQTTLNRGATYPLELRPGLSWPGYSPDLHWRVWVDWNRDGDFEDAGEQMVSTANGNQPLTTSLQVPANAAIGLTKMRIAVQKDGFPSNSCASVPAGEIEDYALNIQAGGVDLTPPTVQLSTPNDPVSGAFDVSVTFSEPIQNLSLNNFILLNGQAIALSGSGAQWLVTINPLLEGIVKVEIPANVVFDLAGNGNLESNQLQVDYVEGQGGPCQQLTNVALSKTASQSSVSPSIQPPPDAQYGVDGITNNQWGSNFSLCATRWEPEQWWEVDLGEVYNLSELRIWNAQGPNGDLFVNYWVFVSKTPFTSTDPTSTATQADFSVYKTQVAGRYESIDLLGSKGRYLRVQLTGTSFLMMEEMEVMGCGLNDNPANCTLSDPGSFLFPGDLMFTAFDNSIDNNENDRIEITPFTTLTKGTQFILTNAEYQANPNGKGRWLAPDGRLDGSIPAQLFTYIGEEDIPVGTPISFVLPDQAPFLATSFRIGDRTTGYFCVEHVGDENHAINISTTGADALFLMQGDWERNQLFGLFNGRVLSGLQDGGLWGDLPPDIACLAIQAFSVPGFHCPYYQGSFLDVVPVADFVSNWIVQSCSTGDDLPVRNATTRAGEEEVNNDLFSLDMGMKAFPNPFSDFTQIEYWLQQSADTEVVLYDLTGRKIRQLKTSGQQAAGLYRLQLEGQGLSGNLYLIRLRVDDKQLVEKITFFEN